jgi:hypothetical protein
MILVRHGAVPGACILRFDLESNLEFGNDIRAAEAALGLHRDSFDECEMIATHPIPRFASDADALGFIGVGDGARYNLVETGGRFATRLGPSSPDRLGLAASALAGYGVRVKLLVG